MTKQKSKSTLKTEATIDQRVIHEQIPPPIDYIDFDITVLNNPCQLRISND